MRRQRRRRVRVFERDGYVPNLDTARADKRAFGKPDCAADVVANVDTDVAAFVLPHRKPECSDVDVGAAGSDEGADGSHGAHDRAFGRAFKRAIWDTLKHAIGRALKLAVSRADRRALNNAVNEPVGGPERSALVVSVLFPLVFSIQNAQRVADEVAEYKPVRSAHVGADARGAVLQPPSLLRCRHDGRAVLSQILGARVDFENHHSASNQTHRKTQEAVIQVYETPGPCSPTLTQSRSPVVENLSGRAGGGGARRRDALRVPRHRRARSRPANGRGRGRGRLLHWGAQRLVPFRRACAVDPFVMRCTSVCASDLERREREGVWASSEQRAPQQRQ